MADAPILSWTRSIPVRARTLSDIATLLPLKFAKISFKQRLFKFFCLGKHVVCEQRFLFKKFVKYYAYLCNKIRTTNDIQINWLIVPFDVLNLQMGALKTNHVNCLFGDINI